MSIAALVLGIISLTAYWVVEFAVPVAGVLAIIFGVIGYRKPEERHDLMAIYGVALGILGLVVYVIVLLDQEWL